MRCRTGSIGFLAASNRVNVMLSRAKLGMIILGNEETLTAKKRTRPTMMTKVWRMTNFELTACSRTGLFAYTLEHITFRVKHGPKNIVCMHQVRGFTHLSSCLCCQCRSPHVML